jgi:hypothetical protein
MQQRGTAMYDSHRLNPAAVIALKDALSLIYWYKRDLRTFLAGNLSRPQILGRLNWDDYKRNIVDQLVSHMVDREDLYRDDLLELIRAVCSMKDFSHLERLEDGPQKVQEAKRAVQAVERLARGHIKLFEEKKEAERRRQAYSDQLAQRSLFQEKLEKLHQDYVGLVVSTNPQSRGYRLEKLLVQLFDLFDLDPKVAFRVTGEQIDGAFTYGDADYLVEVKWQDKPVRAADLDALAGKVRRKLDNTLGLYLSISGFSQRGVEAHSSGRRLLLLMDGSDLLAVLEGRIDFPDLLLRKRRHAAQTGEIYLTYRCMVQAS